MANEFKVKKGLIVEGSGGTILDIQGSVGQLFSITDSLTGDLFAVSDISGIPILNVNSSGAVDIDGDLSVTDDVTLSNFGAGYLKTNVNGVVSNTATIPWATVSSTPTTISGYGITDALAIGTTATTALAGNTTIPSGNAVIDWTTDQGSTNIHSGNYSNTQLSNAEVISAVVASNSIDNADKGTIRSNIGAGTSSLAIGTTASTAMAGNTAFASTAQGTLADNALPKAGGTMTGTLVAPTIKLALDTGNNVNSRVTVYESGATSYGMMLWNDNATSGDWATMIYGPNQSNRKISFGKANSNFPGTKASVDELAYVDLDNGNFVATGTLSGTNFSGSSSGTNTGDQDLSSFITSQRAISSTPTDGATTTAISSDWAFDNVKTAVPANALFTDANTTYSAGTGLDLTGTTFSIESDLRDGITKIGKDSSNYIAIDADDNNSIDFYVSGVWVARMEADGDLHIKGDVIAFSDIFNP